MNSDPLLSREVFAPPVAGNARTGRACMHSGARFVGVQRSGRKEYSVSITLDAVSIPEGVVNGVLEIHGLTPELPSLQTWFEGEIIGDKGPCSGFLTSRWGATETDDLRHWGRFAPFRALKSQLVKPHLTYCNSERPQLFMRFKERFVVPPRQAQNIHGASYAGFYYIMLDFNPTTVSSPTLLDHSIPRPLSPPTLAPRSLRPLPSPSPEHHTRMRLPLPRPTSARHVPSTHLDEPPVLEEEVAAPLSSPRLGRSETTAPQGASRPRRASSRSVSYADAAAGRVATHSAPEAGMEAVVGTPPIPSTNPIAIPSASHETPPKDVDPHEAESTSSAQSSSAASSSFFPSSSPSTSTSSTRPSSPAEPVAIPTPYGTTLDDFPVPGSPPLGSSGRLRSTSRSSSSGSASRGGREQRRRGSSGGFAGEREPAARGRSINEGMAGQQGQLAEGHGEGRGEGGRRDRRESVGEKEGAGTDTWGMNSWSQATMTGFYFFRHSEPYQELSLTYVPQNRGGSQAFAFR